MATNKHAIVRYNTLNKCFSNRGRKYYIEDLVKACNHALYEFYGIEDGVKKRQIFEDVKFMESARGDRWHCRFQGMPQLEWLVEIIVRLEGNFNLNKK